MRRFILAALALSIVPLAMPLASYGATPVKVSVHDRTEGNLIPKEIYGQFAEHVGRCVYDGIWVGKNSPIPNIDGYRTDIVEALKLLKVPVLRWPGGCFGDEYYHWMDGIGPQEDRPKTKKADSTGTVEDNSFGTHEFMRLCEMLGCEPYISGNVGSGSVEELAKWVEYMTAREGTLAELRAKNGRKEPWKVKYLGIGNENWGCGGEMRPEYYADVYRRYATYCRDYDGNKLFKVAAGASMGLTDDDFSYYLTKILMSRVGNMMDALSIHYYTLTDWDNMCMDIDFDDDYYYAIVGKAAKTEEFLEGNERIMDFYDPERKIAIFFDEWGTWYSRGGRELQQNTMRDAMVAAISLNIFHAHTDRVKMANIAQMVNLLQSMILTRDDEMVLTPTYHVFRMFNVHQDARFIPTDCDAGKGTASSGEQYPLLSVSTSRSGDGSYNISIANISLHDGKTVEMEFDSLRPSGVKAEILTSEKAADYNDFGEKDRVRPVAFKGFEVKDNKVVMTLPAASIVVLNVK